MQGYIRCHIRCHRATWHPHTVPCMSVLCFVLLRIYFIVAQRLTNQCRHLLFASVFTPLVDPLLAAVTAASLLRYVSEVFFRFFQISVACLGSNSYWNENFSPTLLSFYKNGNRFFLQIRLELSCLQPDKFHSPC